MKKVALIGFARNTRALAPFDDPSVELWGLNEGYILGEHRVDRWFQLHTWQSFTRSDNHNDPKHFEWLRQKHDFPIYMQKKYPQIPSSVAYPLKKIKAEFGLGDDKEELYATSSFSYMMMQAIQERYDWIGVYGFEMATDTEYSHQRPNAEYLIGYARGLGLTVEIPKQSNLLRGRMYGYEDDSVGIRQMLEYRQAILVKQMESEQMHFYELRGRSAMLEEVFTKKLDPTMENLRIAQQAMLDSSALANTVNGARNEVGLMIKIFDSHNGSKVVEDELKKEIEPDRAGTAGS